MKTLIVGAGGLLGRVVFSAVRRAPHHAAIDARITWSDSAMADRQLAAYAEMLVSGDDAWQVLWCAGAGVNGMTTEQFDREVSQLERFLSKLSSASGSDGTFFLASSAGGVYAGSSGSPFDEFSPTAPLSAYGVAKLQMENAARQFHVQSGISVLIGRFSNLYGPGQNLEKQQGLISHLCLGSIERRPVSIFVPLDTIRDYLFVDDAALMILDALDAHRASGDPIAVKIFASQRGTTVATLIAGVNIAAGIKAPIILGSSPLSAFQSRDIRLRSRVLTAVDRRVLTPLPVGISKTWSSLFGLYARVGRRRF